MCVSSACIGFSVCATNVPSSSQVQALWLRMTVVVLVSEQVFKVLRTFGHIERNRNEMYHICPTSMNYKPNRKWNGKRNETAVKSLPYSLLMVQSHGNIMCKWLLWFKQIPEKWHFCRFRWFFPRTFFRSSTTHKIPLNFWDQIELHHPTLPENIYTPVHWVLDLRGIKITIAIIRQRER